MKSKVGILVSLSIFSFVSCKADSGSSQYALGSQKKSGTTSSNNSSNSSAATDDDSMKYLYDMLAADTTGSGTDVAHVTLSVARDIDPVRLTKLAEHLLSAGDKDKSGALSLDEFLAGAELLAKRFATKGYPTIPDNKKVLILSKIQEDFQRYAGSDSQMGIPELRDLLASQAPRISMYREHSHRHGDFGRGGEPPRDIDVGGGGELHPPMVPASWDEILKKYDKNKDGLLSQDEFAAFMADRPGAAGAG